MSTRPFYWATAVAMLGMAVVSPAQQIVINEIHYHPSGAGVTPPDDPEWLQYIELHNTGSAPVDLAGWSFGAGVEFVFPAGASIPANGFILVADNPTFLRAMIPGIPIEVQVYQVVAGSDLSNSGDHLVLLDAASAVVDDVTFDDVAPWPAAADGSGPSLELINPTYDNAYPAAWKASVGLNGTPGQINSRFTEGPAILWEDPPRSSVVPDLTQVEVMFAESVTGVVAADLTVAGSPATVVTGSGAGPYVFTGFAAPTQVSVSVTLGPGAIQDLDSHAYAGDAWLYSLAVPKVVINEIHYNPPEDPDVLEFIEIVNADSVAVDISGWHLTEFASPGVTFPAGTILQPGAYAVAAKDPDALWAQLGCAAYGWGTNDSLSNGGEPVALRDANGVLVDRVYYNDDSGWPTSPDGSGPSLERINPTLGEPCTEATQAACSWQASAWRASLVLNGTCGATNSVYSTAPLVTATDPVRGSVVEVLSQVSVTFSVPVTGVTADDLMVDGDAATGVSGSGAGPYVFTVTPPIPGTLEVVLRGDGGIQDLNSVPFAGDSWLYFSGLPKIVINEIHYHPATSSVLLGENPEDLQFLELYNYGTVTVDLSGFALSAGVELTFPAGTTMAPGAYLVVAEDMAFLQSKVTIPGGVTVLEWADGNLANSGETVELTDSYGHILDSVPFDDGGEWAPTADGDGPSLELVNPLMPNEYGGAWRASLVNLGTPGAVNGRYAAVPPPVISAVRHDPAIPGANAPVTITAFVIDESVTPTVTLQYRQDQEPTIAYTAIQMLDDGLNGDGAAGDDVYGVVLAGLAEGQRLDFAVQASDGVATAVAPSGHDGVFPGAGGHPPRVFLCKFSSAALPSDFPSYHLITTQYTRNLQETRNKNEYDATFIRCPAGGAVSQCEVFYNVIERYRGQSSLYQNPPSYRIDLHRPLASELGFEVTSVLMMAQQAARQSLGYDMFEDAGLPTPKHHLVRFNTNPLASGGTQNWVYINAERVDEDFFTSQDGAIQPLRFPDRCESAGNICDSDSDCPPGDVCISTDDGNCYRGRHNDASLYWEGFNPNSYRTDANDQNGYQKVTREDEDEWDDLIALCDALTCSTSDGGVLCLENNYQGWFEENLVSYVDAEQWARWVAIHMLLDNTEGGIYRDTGDDYFLYFWPGPGYGHATFVPWDMDAIMPSFHETIWRTGQSNANFPLRRFLRSNEYAGLFVGAICEYMDTIFSQAAMNARIDALPDVLFPTGTPQGSGPQTKQGLKDWVAAQRTAINNEIRRQTTLQGVPASPYESEDPVILLSGQLNQCWAREVRVNGVSANYTIANPDGVGASWTYNFTLNPGPNSIIVQTLDHSGAEIDRAEGYVTYVPPATGDEQALKLTMPTRMVSDKTFTLKAEVVDGIGRIDWRTWTEVGIVSARRVSDQVAVPLTVTVFETYPAGTGSGGPPTSDSIRFYNGVGTVSFTFNDPASVADQDVEITVTVGELSESRVVHALANVPGIYRNLSGTLSGAGLTWGPGDGVIHLTGNVTVPSGSTLTIQPGTLVMAEPGPTGDGTRVIVNGVVNAPGTEAEPILFFPAAGPAAMTLPDHNVANPSSWRGFTHTGSGTSTFSHVFVTGAGNAPVESHPRPLVFGVESSASLSLIDCVVADCGGKIVHMTGSGTITLRRTVWSRVGYGGEFLGGSHTLLAEDCWFTRIGRAPEANDADGDVFHLDNASSHQTIRRCILADCGDDMMDHSGANPVVEDSIIWDADDKCVSLSSGGSISFDNVLVFSMPIGINGAGGIVTQSTLACGAPINGAPISVERSIIWPNGINTGACNGNINYTDAGSTAHIACGTGNINVNPQFESTASLAWDYDPAVGSPALTAGPTGGRIGWLGFPDGSICTVADDCEDGNACTVDTCVNGACVFEAIPGCEACETAAECDDGNPCNVDACTAGACTHVAGNNGAVCNDGWDCTINDTCVAGACVGTESCPPGQSCSPTTGECVAGPQTLTFQQGVNGYSGTADTYIDAALGSQATTTPIVIDGDPVEHVLIRFDGIFGSGANQIPVGSTITSATLTLRVGSGANDQSANAVNYHRLLHSWVDTDVWAAYGVAPWNATGGIQADGDDAVATAEATATMSTASTAYPVSVTGSVQAWALDPSTNYGWAILPTGTDGLRLESSESTTASYRPLLSITYTVPVTTCTSDAECDDGLYCNGDEWCDLGASVCVPGEPPDCSDLLVCTVDTCDEATDSCVHTPNAALCDDGDVCNGAETCSELFGCGDGIPLDCDDGIACTADTCVSLTGCQHTDACPAGLSCNLTTGLCEAGPQTVTYQQDVNGYTGTQDTYLDESEVSTVEGALDTWRWDTENPSPYQEFGLIRFDNIIGSGANQIPLGSTINSATLTLVVFNAGVTPAGNVNEVAVDWSQATATWNNFGDDPGVQSDEYGDFVANAPIASGTVNITVTSSLQAWSNDPAANRGWIFIPQSNDGVQVRSAEYATIADRPLLTIEYIPPSSPCDSNDDCDDFNACTDDACVDFVCQHTAVSCDDTLFCTEDTCNPATGCVHTPRNCADAVACTIDVCDEDNDVCVNTPDDLACDDGVGCTTDNCDPIAGCTHTDNCTGGQVCNHATGLCETPTYPPLPIVYGDTWKYFKGTEEPTPTDLTAWTQVTFDDSAWSEGPSGLGYDFYVETGGTNGNGDYGPFIGTELDDMCECTTRPPCVPAGQGYLSVYMRKTFTVINPAAVTSLTFQMYADDGYVAYLNGTEVARIRLNGTPPAYNTSATTAGPSVAPPVEQTLDLTSYTYLLQAGVNVLAVQGHNVNLTSRDLLMIPQLSSTQGCTTNADCDDDNVCNGLETCNTGTGECVAGTPLFCDDGLYCNGAETCDPISGCAAGAAPCAADEACDEANDVCAGAPTVEAVGGRYLMVTPPPSLPAVALQVSSAGITCLPRYVDATGRLVDEPVYRSSADWDTILIADEETVPSTLYEVRSAVLSGGSPAFSGPASATTWLWGDTTGDAATTVLDILCVLDGFQDVFGQCSLAGDDLMGEVPDADINLLDITAVCDAFGGLPYPDSNPCGASKAGRGPAVLLIVAPRAATVYAGESVAVDVFARGSPDLRGYQLALSVGPMQTDMGGLEIATPRPVRRGDRAVPPPVQGLTVETLEIDVVREDYVFQGLESFPVVDAVRERLASATLAGGVAVADTRYLATFVLRASAGARGRYLVGLRRDASMAVDTAGALLEIEQWSSGITVIRNDVPVE
ncbi:MAG: lamin tail domain-containing protein [Phycisphaerae bacterium]|nr:lamin tail domain-containing protein [Phycisphaerae bacterium]